MYLKEMEEGEYVRYQIPMNEGEGGGKIQGMKWKS